MSSLTDGDATSSRSQRLVMVVDENVQRQQQLRDALTRHGLRPECACFPDEALRRCASLQPALVVMAAKEANGAVTAFAGRLRALVPHAALLLLSPGPRPADPAIRACLPPELPPEAIAREVTRWLTATSDATLAQAPRTVLLVDDEPKWRQILTEFLELNGFSVAAVGTGEEAVAYLATEHPRVLVLDLRMPGMDGLLTLKHIRVAHPNLPVIVVSQTDEDWVRE